MILKNIFFEDNVKECLIREAILVALVLINPFGMLVSIPIWFCIGWVGADLDSALEAKKNHGN